MLTRRAICLLRTPLAGCVWSRFSSTKSPSPKPQLGPVKRSGVPDLPLWARIHGQVAVFRLEAEKAIQKSATDPTPAIAASFHFGALSLFMSYFATDVLVLRMLAVSSVVFMNLVPNWWRSNWVNLVWGSLFFSINVVRGIELYCERTATAQSLGFSADELAVYEAKFHAHMTPRCFHRLLKLAEWR
eukprot:CAMPEP_0172622944 /NCGR_PEP_ID=MMETSP1068-20121228/124594_1 /TAXON_ID=35684 /ORGANISM="Pseudopedinella elastica, Strain CCMP716" /LENGTH=186 /DNA_ID=CAMNT_0013431305 /DNA_START=108 /DNA_END=665 /DNA_ORIENTATION=+